MIRVLLYIALLPITAFTLPLSAREADLMVSPDGHSITVVSEGATSLVPGEGDKNPFALLRGRESALVGLSDHLESDSLVLAYSLSPQEIRAALGFIPNGSVVLSEPSELSTGSGVRIALRYTLSLSELRSRIREAASSIPLRQNLALLYELTLRELERISDLEKGLADSDTVEATIRRLKALQLCDSGLRLGFSTLEPYPKAGDARLTRAGEQDSSFAYPLLWRGHLHLQQSRPDEAIQDFTQAIKRNEALSRAYRLRAEANLMRGRKEAAIGDLTMVVEKNPLEAPAFGTRGSLYAELRMHKKAVEDFSAAIDINPNYADALFMRGKVLAQTGEHLKAIEDFKQAIVIDPTNPVYFLHSGMSYEALGEYEREAIRKYTRVLELSPDDTETRFRRASLFAAISKHKKAIDDFATILEFTPNDTTTLFHLGRSLLALKKNQKALRAFSMVIDLDPYYADAYYNRGYTKASMGRFNDALDDFEKALRLEPSMAKAYYNRGFIYYKLDRFESAAADLNKYLELRGNSEGMAWKTRKLIRKMGYRPEY